MILNNLGNRFCGLRRFLLGSLYFLILLCSLNSLRLYVFIAFDLDGIFLNLLCYCRLNDFIRLFIRIFFLLLFFWKLFAMVWGRDVFRWNFSFWLLQFPRFRLFHFNFFQSAFVGTFRWLFFRNWRMSRFGLLRVLTLLLLCLLNVLINYLVGVHFGRRLMLAFALFLLFGNFFVLWRWGVLLDVKDVLICIHNINFIVLDSFVMYFGYLLIYFWLAYFFFHSFFIILMNIAIIGTLLLLFNCIYRFVLMIRWYVRLWHWIYLW